MPRDAMPISMPLSTSTSANSFPLIRLTILLLSRLPRLLSSPLAYPASISNATAPSAQDEPPTDSGPTFVVDLTVASILVLTGGVFAGLTIALMGQDTVNLQVIADSGDAKEQRHASRVLRLLAKGKHWVLVTLLLGNVIVNEALPIVLDRSLGGGWLAIVGSTVLIVIFGEIIPQSVCVRYGLEIGAHLCPFVQALMYIFAPVAYPTAKLLDYSLGEDHGTLYKKAGLKTLITLHKALGAQQAERLNQDEVTIIQSVLDLKDKTVGSIMTPLRYVFTLSRDAVLDQRTIDYILSAGYSRIPIHSVENPLDFEGMLLVKTLITYDPEDGKRVSDFALATLPETKPETSCLDILNYFQEGQSHMVLVSEDPTGDKGALGVVTLEDVIEELIGEEIIDESDIYVDNTSRVLRKPVSPSGASIHPDIEARATRLSRGFSTFAKNLRLRRAFSSAGIMREAAAQSQERGNRDGGGARSSEDDTGALAAAAAAAGVLPQPLPSNNALNPRSTRYGNVKIKQRQLGQLGERQMGETGKGRTVQGQPKQGEQAVGARSLEDTRGQQRGVLENGAREGDERTPLLGGRE